MSAEDDKVSKGVGAPSAIPPTSARPAGTDKGQRRADALRANLQRRKAQQRDRAKSSTTPRDQA